MPTKAQQERVGKWVSRWKSKLLLDNWSVVVEYKEESTKSKRTDAIPADSCAEILVDPRYREAVLTVYPAFFAKPVGFQRATILHEVAHIVTDPVLKALSVAHNKGAISARQRDDVSEGVTEDLAKIVLRFGKPAKDNYRL